MEHSQGETQFHQRERILAIEYRNPEAYPTVMKAIQLSQQYHNSVRQKINLPPIESFSSSVRLIDHKSFRNLQEILGTSPETSGVAIRELGLAFVAAKYHEAGRMHGEAITLAYKTAHELSHLASAGLQNTILDEGFTDVFAHSIVGDPFIKQYCSEYQIEWEQVRSNRQLYIEKVSPVRQGIRMKESEIIYAEKDQSIAGIAYPGSFRLVTDMFKRVNPRERGNMLQIYYKGEQEWHLHELIDKYYGKQVADLVRTDIQNLEEIIRRI
jgi:hypothetical protein